MTVGAFLHKPERARKKPKRLKRQSAKRAAFAPVRAAFVTGMLARYPVCMVCPLLFVAIYPALAAPTMPTVKEQMRLCDDLGSWALRHISRWAHCTVESTLLHEPLTRARAGRTDDNLLDPENAVPSCWLGHKFLHAHVALSTSVGLLRSTHG